MKKALTFIEVVFVIVIIGILSAILAPNFQSESLAKVANQLASHIRYTQHLALMDDKFQSNVDNWHKARWHISFNGTRYTIASDFNQDGIITSNEIARNPSNRQLVLSGDQSISGVADKNYTKELNLNEKFGIQSVTLQGGCTNNSISFDYLGRPINSNSLNENFPYTNTLIHSDCTILIKDTQSRVVTLVIENETGYVNINF